MGLPADSSLDRLIAATAAINPNTIVINSTGFPTSMPWIDSVAAVIQAWFPGQEAGNSIADVLLGAVNPSGKSLVTFPKSLKDTPAYSNLPGDLTTQKVTYAEGIYMGYRHFDRKPETILFPCRVGLSYTSFVVSKASLSGNNLQKEDSITINANVTNNGSVAGREVIQVYVGSTASSSTIDRPEKQLAGFAKRRCFNRNKKRMSVW